MLRQQFKLRVLTRKEATMRSTPTKGRAFTLIELLVVIAIIAILAAIPSRCSHRRGKRPQERLPEQHAQISNAILMYTQDYDEAFPLNRYNMRGSTVDATWREAVLPYGKSIGIFKDPSNPDAKIDKSCWGSPLVPKSMPTTATSLAAAAIRRTRPMGPDMAEIQYPGDLILLADMSRNGCPTPATGASPASWHVQLLQLHAPVCEQLVLHRRPCEMEPGGDYADAVQPVGTASPQRR